MRDEIKLSKRDLDKDFAPYIEDFLNGYITPEKYKLILSKAYIFYTTHEDFVVSQEKEEDTCQIRDSFLNLLSFFDKLESYKSNNAR